MLLHMVTLYRKDQPVLIEIAFSDAKACGEFLSWVSNPDRNICIHDTTWNVESPIFDNVSDALSKIGIDFDKIDEITKELENKKKMN